MGDVLTSQLHQLAFAVVTGTLRLTPAQRDAIADLNAAAAQADASSWTGDPGRARLVLVPPPPTTKEPA